MLRLHLLHHLLRRLSLLLDLRGRACRAGESELLGDANIRSVASRAHLLLPGVLRRGYERVRF